MEEAFKSWTVYLAFVIEASAGTAGIIIGIAAFDATFRSITIFLKRHFPEKEKRKYIVMQDEDFKRANPKASQTIDIEDLVKLSDIDPLMFERPYYSVPQKGGEKGYFLLREALSHAEKAAVATWLKPVLVAEVDFAMWTRDGMLRVPVFKGLREDKPAIQIKKESPSNPITHPEKIIFPKEHITKQDIADYYSTVSQWMLPYLSNRPLSLYRCPEGVKAQCFYQKHIGQVLATKDGSLQEVQIEESNGMKGSYIAVNDLEGLTSLVQMGAFEIHAWGSRHPNVDYPDQIVMDFDPDPAVRFSEVKKAALGLKSILDQLKLKSFLKVTGGKGIHVHVPISPVYTWDQVKSFSKALADELVSRFPQKYTSNISKKKRKNKIFIDYLRNGRSATAVSPYSLRARPQSSVALPISWKELKSLKSADQFTLQKALLHLKKRRLDPWSGMLRLNQRIKILTPA